MTPPPFAIGFVLMPGVTQLDLTGPYEVFARLPGAELHLLWKTLDPVRSDRGLALLPTTTFADCPPLDLICVPGGPGVNALLTDREMLRFLRRIAGKARFVTSVCTGSLLLGAAGLLAGRRATCHWTSRELLREFAAIPTDARVVVDGHVITGGGVTAGIDFALRVIAEIRGQDTAEKIQLSMEYDPQPPFQAGSIKTARPTVVDAVRHAAGPMLAERAAAVRQASKALVAAYSGAA